MAAGLIEPGRPYSMAALADALGWQKSYLKGVLLRLGIDLSPTELHYTDERPRATARRNFRRMTAAEVQRVITYVRARQGERALRRATR